MNRKQLGKARFEIQALINEAQNLNIMSDKLTDKLIQTVKEMDKELATPAEPTSEVDTIQACIRAINNVQHYRSEVKMNQQKIVYINFTAGGRDGNLLMVEDVRRVLADLLKAAKAKNA